MDWLKKISSDFTHIDEEVSPYKEGEILIFDCFPMGIQLIKVVSFEEYKRVSHDSVTYSESRVPYVTIESYDPSGMIFLGGKYGIIAWQELARNLKESIQNELKEQAVYLDTILERLALPDVASLQQRHPELIGYKSLKELIQYEIITIDNHVIVVIFDKSLPAFDVATTHYWYWYLPELNRRSISENPPSSFATPQEAVSSARDYLRQHPVEVQIPKLGRNITQVLELIDTPEFGPFEVIVNRSMGDRASIIIKNDKRSDDKYFNIRVVFDIYNRKKDITCLINIYFDEFLSKTKVFDIRPDKIKNLPYELVVKAYELIKEADNDDNGGSGYDVPEPDPTNDVGSPNDLVLAQKNIKTAMSIDEAVEYKSQLKDRWFSLEYWKGEVTKTAESLLYDSYKKYYKEKFGELSFIGREPTDATPEQKKLLDVLRYNRFEYFRDEATEKCVVGIGPYRSYSPTNWKASNGIYVSGSPNGWNGSFHAAEYEEAQVYMVACDIDKQKAEVALREYEDEYRSDIFTERWERRNQVREGD